MIPRQHEHSLRETILRLLAERRPGATICPSEVARVLFPEDWRAQMDAVRAVALSMAKKGLIEVSQKGARVDPRKPFHGPVRLGLPKDR